jgi:excinuclease ABC subunit C
MLGAFLTQYYLNAAVIPPEVHLPSEPEDESSIAAMLTERAGRRVAIVCPERGEKARLIRMTAMNAETIIRERFEKRERAKGAAPGTLLALARDLHLAEPPRTIACIDISHLHGTDTVASLVFFRDGKPEKKEYRHFKIGTVEGVDDFMSMREVVTRYVSRRIDEGHELPGLLLVDGGKGQLSSAQGALRDLGVKGQAVAGLAKRLEEVFLPGAPEAQNIPKTSSALHLLQRIRDEAHRFALTYQKKLRKKRVISSSLDAIPGIGPKRAEALLRHFGSVAAIKRAEVGDIAAVPGVGEKKAQAVYDGLRGKGEDGSG